MGRPRTRNDWGELTALVTSRLRRKIYTQRDAHRQPRKHFNFGDSIGGAEHTNSFWNRQNNIIHMKQELLLILFSKLNKTNINRTIE